MTQDPNAQPVPATDQIPPAEQLTEVGTVQPQPGQTFPPTPAEQFTGAPQTDASGASIPPADSAQPSPELTQTAEAPAPPADQVADSALAAPSHADSIESLSGRVLQLEQYVARQLGYVSND